MKLTDFALNLTNIVLDPGTPDPGIYPLSGAPGRKWPVSEMAGSRPVSLRASIKMGPPALRAGNRGRKSKPPGKIMENTDSARIRPINLMKSGKISAGF